MHRDRAHTIVALLTVVALVVGCGSAASSPAPDGQTAQPTTVPSASAAAALPTPSTAIATPVPTPVAPSASPASTPVATATPNPLPSPLPTPAPTPASCVSLGVYTIVAGDTLWEIAQDHGVTLDALLAANPQIRDRSLIRPGDRIVIAGPLVAIVDTLGAATPAVTFDAPGSWGDSISDRQNAGPLFSLADPTCVTEIGGFLSYYRAPLSVEIRPSVDGVPDVFTVLATFELPISSTEPTVSYVAVTPGVVLPPGTYFAMFAPQAGDVGSLLGGASVPFEYRAGSTPMGYLNAIEGTSSASPGMYVAVRILGRPLPP